jgi:uncharacterized delta-60 repeat protein
MNRMPRSRWLAGPMVAVSLVIALLGATAMAAGFSSGGVAEVPLPTAEGNGLGPAGISDLSRAPDGDLLAAVSDFSTSGTFAVARLRPGGAIDHSFGEAGFTDRLKVGHVGRSEAQAEGIVATSAGGAVVVGYLHRGGGGFATLLARYRPNGSLDPSFGKDGVVASSPPATGGAAFHDVAIRPDGSIVAVGALDERGGGRSAALVTAYEKNGQVERSFGDGGSFRLKAQRGMGSYTGLLAVQALSNGKVLVAGYRGHDLILMKLDRDGVLDRSFGGGDGIAAVDVGADACCTEAASIALQRDGRIVVGGNGGAGISYREALVRFRPDGSPDPSFGHHGEVLIGRSHLRTLRAVAVRRSGRIVVAGEGISSSLPGGPFFTALGFRADGRADRSFGHGGVSQITAAEVSAARAAVTAGDKVIAAGGLRREAEGEYRYSLLLRQFR